jgi:putative membrane protein
MNAMSEETKDPTHEKGQLDPDKIEAEILANERTFLAWVRTSIAVISLGFVIARFSLWIRELSLQVNPQLPPHRVGLSVPLGEWMIGIGAVLTLFAAWRYRVVNRAIRRGEIEADERMVIAVTLIVIGAAVAVITYMIVAAKPG